MIGFKVFKNTEEFEDWQNKEGKYCKIVTMSPMPLGGEFNEQDDHVSNKGCVASMSIGVFVVFHYPAQGGDESLRSCKTCKHSDGDRCVNPKGWCNNDDSKPIYEPA